MPRCFGAPGKGNPVYIGVARQRDGAVLCIARNHRDHSRRETRRFDQLGKFKHRRGCDLRRFQHNGTARCQSRAEFRRCQEHLRVPGHNRHHHANWLLPGKDVHVRLVDRQHRALDLVCQPRIVAIVIPHIGSLAGRLSQQLAAVRGLNRPDLGCMRLNQFGQTVEQFAPLRLCHVAPRRVVQAPTCGGDRACNVIG